MPLSISYSQDNGGRITASHDDVGYLNTIEEICDATNSEDVNKYLSLLVGSTKKQKKNIALFFMSNKINMKVLDKRVIEDREDFAELVVEYKITINDDSFIIVALIKMRRIESDWKLLKESVVSKKLESNFRSGRCGIQDEPVFNDEHNVLENDFNMIEVFDELKIDYQNGEAEKVDLAIDALPINLWQTQGFDSTLCLLASHNYDSNPIGTLEHVYTFVKLNSEYDNNPRAVKQSLNAYLAKEPNAYSLPLTKKHYTSNRWRENLIKTFTIYCCSYDLDTLFQKFYEHEYDRKIQPSNRKLQLSNRVEAVNSQKNEMDMEKIFFQNISQDVQSHFTPPLNYKPHEALFCELDDFERTAYRYHWALGYCSYKTDI